MRAAGPETPARSPRTGEAARARSPLRLPRPHHPSRLPSAPVSFAVAAVLALVLAPWAASAQTVRGRLLEESTAVPIAGALVELRTLSDTAVDRVLTDPGGRFTVRAPSAGRYELHAERIGYRDWDSDPFDLAAGQSVSRTLRISTRPVSLPSLSVEAEGRCRLARDQGVATVRVWSEVKKALELTELSRQGEAYEFVERKYTREVAVDGHKVRSEEASIDTAVRTRPYTTLSAERLARDGFVYGDIESGRTYFAPDVETLLSDPFVDTHCLEVSGDRDVDGERWVGLAFRPVEDRSLPEVAGTLWLAEDGSGLREMDFHYVNVEIPGPSPRRHGENVSGNMLRVRDAGARQGIGGTMSFTRLPTGRWIIRDWKLTLPRIGATKAWWNRSQRYAYVLSGLHEEGGEVLRARSDSGQLLFEHERAVLAGSVADSTRGAPLAGAVVRLEGTPWADTTDADGRYRIAGLEGGSYEVRIRDPRLDSLGVETLGRDVELREGTVTEASFSVPSWRTVLAGGCAEAAAGGSTARPGPPPGSAGSATVVGIVTDAASGTPLAGATVTLFGGAEAGGQGRPVAPARSTGALGTFAFCGVPSGAPLRLAAAVPGRPSVRVALRPAGSDTLERDLVVPEARPAGVLGRVVDDATGAPVGSARIRLAPAGNGTPFSGTSDPDGRFRLEGVPAGRWAVSVEAVGYGAARDTVSLERGTGLRLDVRLSSNVATLSPIRVEVVGRHRTEAASAFSHEASRVYGLDREQIEKRLPGAPAVKDLLRDIHAPGYHFTQTRNEASMETGVCATFARQTTPGTRGCAAVYLDDVQLTDQQGNLTLQNLDPESLCRIEVVPPIEAGSRLGTSAAYGAILLYTKPCE